MPDFNCLLNLETETPALYLEQASDLTASTSAIHLGGLFNSFYPFDWVTITGASTFHFTASFENLSGFIEIYAHSDKENVTLIHKEQVDSGESKISIELASLKLAPGLRLSAKFISASKCSILAAGWDALSNRVASPVKLAVVICTYNNEELLKDNILKLINSEVWLKEDIILLLANNGILNDSSYLPQERFYKFDQPNLGGSGGFGRGIYEVIYGAAKNTNITHILLMDDDVKFHPEIIHRTIRFYEKSGPSCCIGGSMLKLEDPSWLHEAGSNLNSIKTIGTSTKVTIGNIEKTDALEQVGQARIFDYNAWWFCSFPVKAVKKSGLPLPIFIHGDDIEYGIRLKQNGFKMFCPGGISLWHQDFETKHLTWIRYFDFRNALIRLTYHNDNPPKVLIHQLKQVCNRAVIRNDYGGFIMAVKAFEDFCKGPEILLNTDFQTQIRELDVLYHQYAISDSTGRYKFSNGDILSQQKKRIRKAIKYLTSNLHFLPLPSIKHYETDNARFPWADVPYLADISVKLPNGDIAHYNRDLEKYRRLQKKLRKTLREYSPKLSSIQETWLLKRASFHSQKFWYQYTK